MKRKKASNASHSSGQIRIIGGQYRSRKLKVHDIEGLRPTTDRVKETVFNWLMNDVANALVLDCFAGSGGLGFEALSRYAQQVTFIEKSQQASRQLVENIKILKAANANVIENDCLTALSKITNPFDLVFIDPPFRKGLAQLCCDSLGQRQLLKRGALIYIEVESELPALKLPENWQQIKCKEAGQVRFELWQVN